MRRHVVIHPVVGGRWRYFLPMETMSAGRWVRNDIPSWFSCVRIVFPVTLRRGGSSLMLISMLRALSAILNGVTHCCIGLVDAHEEVGDAVVARAFGKSFGKSIPEERPPSDMHARGIGSVPSRSPTISSPVSRTGLKGFSAHSDTPLHHIVLPSPLGVLPRDVHSRFRLNQLKSPLH